MKDGEDDETYTMYAKKQNKIKMSQNQQMSNFSPYANFNCLYFKIGPCDLLSSVL